MPIFAGQDCKGLLSVNKTSTIGVNVKPFERITNPFHVRI